MNWKGVEIGEKNREAVRQWLATHLGGTQAECAADLRLSPMAVNRHVKSIRAEWKRSNP